METAKIIATILQEAAMQMPWFKLFGCVLILFSGLITAYLLNKAETERLRQLDSLIELLRFIRREIDYFCVPVNEIFKRADLRILESCGARGEFCDFDSFVSSLSPEPDEEIKAVLLSFSRELGASYREEQLKNCDLHINALVSIRDRAYAESKKNKKLHTTLCLSAAAAVVLLLI